MLHTLAAMMGPSPSHTEKQYAKKLVADIASSYPCGKCTGHFHKYVK